MNTELFIARRIFTSKENKRSLSNKIVNIALFGIILGLVVMILSVAIVTGFKNEIGRKVVGFGSHLQIVNLDSNQSFETSPINRNQPFLEEIKQLDGIAHLQVFASKPGIIRTNESMQGVVLKGIDSDFDWSFFKKNMVRGEVINLSDTVLSNKVWLSKQVADVLNLNIGDKLDMFFIHENEKVPRQRRFELAGIYKTSLEEFDRLFVLADIKHVQRLNNWSEDQVSGFEVLVDDFKKLDYLEMMVRDIVINHMIEEGPMLRVISIKWKYRNIFDWLGLLDMNVWVILALMVLVAGFNMVSGLLVIILERTQMIGILKAIGSPDWNIRKVFLYFSFFLILKGLLWGNIIGVGICLIQYYFPILKLDPTSYYLEYVPINLKILHLLFLNAGTILVTILMLFVPSYLITKVSPEKTIRFE